MAFAAIRQDYGGLATTAAPLQQHRIQRAVLRSLAGTGNHGVPTPNFVPGVQRRAARTSSPTSLLSGLRLSDEAILLATEQAIADGVDVINFSVSGTAFRGMTRSRSRSCRRATPASPSRRLQAIWVRTSIR
jgi:hypothetical protein